MAELYSNIYARCRQRTGLTQEQWAERIGVSIDSVRSYEGGRHVPSCYIVRQMIFMSGYDALAYQHVISATSILDVLPDIKTDTPLPQAAIQLVNRVNDFLATHKDRQLLQIAEDGIVSEEERPMLNDILALAEDIVSAAYQVRYADDGGGERA